jgi:F-type H+-transporting ATPase subunit delta
MSIKKYVKALVETTTKEHLEEIYSKLTPLVELSKSEKYNLIITSPLITKEKKVEFLVELLEVKDEKIVNLFKLIAENNRLKELPQAVALLKDIIANITGNYKGFVYSKEPLSESKIAEIESKLSKKLGKNIKLTQKTTDKSGVQVYVDSLNVEIAVYEDGIKAKLIENIIRAI